jgi:uncharacterized protein
MQVHVAQLLKAEIGAKREYEVSGAVDIDGSGVESAVSGRVDLMRTNRGILVTGRLQTEAVVACSRCLTSFRYPLDFGIEEEYFPTVDVVSGVSVTLPDDPGAFTIDEHHVIDLTEAARQYALTVLPMKPLCREDCAGLCPRCGRNLNLGPCDCPPEPLDPRWTALADWVNKQKGTG